MGYVKVVKNSNYFRRYKVKYRRRRQCKTDYALRRRLITQDKRKFNAPKYRLVVRVTSHDVTCQVTSAKMIGDHVLCAAYSHELKRYGLKVGLTNYAACYCTGLLLARRLLTKLNMHEFYPGKKRLDGKRFVSHVTRVDWKNKFQKKNVHRPFKCLLDIGLARSSTGARVFGCLKGALDGGLNIPHDVKRFPGFVKAESRNDKDIYHADVHAAKIYGGHVSDYMKLLQTKDMEKYNTHFAKYIAEGVGPDNLEDLYRGVHSAIRKNPESPPKAKAKAHAGKDSKDNKDKMDTEEKSQEAAAAGRSGRKTHSGRNVAAKIRHAGKLANRIRSIAQYKEKAIAAANADK